MKTGDILYSILIIVIFLGLYIANVLAIGIKKVQDNWPLYRCSPAVMPFAGVFGYDVGDNFMGCIQTTQSGYMDYLMIPVKHVIGLVGTVAGKIVKDINKVREFMDGLRNKIIKVIQNTFGVFLNILIAFQKMIINIKDMISKLVGVFITLLYIMQGAMYTIQSMWNGLNGSLVRALG